MKQKLLNTLKNLYGWKTPRKLVIFSIDDYGNVRLDSKEALEKMNRAGLKTKNHFDRFDTLETKEDLEALFETLTSVKDKTGNSAVFTPFALPCNINFEAMKENSYSRFISEELPETFKKQEARHPLAYNGAWELWKEGIAHGLMKPQFHGREHLNLKIFNEKLKSKDPDILINLENRSYTSISNTIHPELSPMAAFDFWEIEENKEFEQMIVSGLDAFERVYGYRSTHFNPPAGRESQRIHQYLNENGIRYIDTPLVKKEHQGLGNYKTVMNYTGKKNKFNQLFLVRNVVFEPTSGSRDWVVFSLKQIEAAFQLKRPAIISSHRVNFCGFIDENNRKKGLQGLNLLLEKIVQRWPEVEFISADELGDIIAEDRK